MPGCGSRRRFSRVRPHRLAQFTVYRNKVIQLHNGRLPFDKERTWVALPRRGNTPDERCFYAGRLHRMVKCMMARPDGLMEQEQERGITITSAATASEAGASDLHIDTPASDSPRGRSTCECRPCRPCSAREGVQPQSERLAPGRPVPRPANCFVNKKDASERLYQGAPAYARAWCESRHSPGPSGSESGQGINDS